MCFLKLNFFYCWFIYVFIFLFFVFFFFKHKTAYEMRISDWSSDVCSSDLSPGDMISFILRRLAQFLVTLLVASFLLFAVTEFSPGNVASKILGPYAVQSQVDLLYDKLDLGAPLLERYGQWLGTLLGLSENRLGDPAIGLGLDDPRGVRYFGNLGYSLMLKEPVVDVLAQRIGHTVALAGWAIGFIVPISLVLGVMSGINAGRPPDRGISGVTVALTPLPEFVTAVVLLLLFSAVLGWLPGTSPLTPDRAEERRVGERRVNQV